ncbi:MAG: lipid-A-disaccharide synthase [Pseudoflavonifractor sp.]|nr:lipid-A-disaccharide synthase [Pseudoflavonifractor sp.]
MKYFISAGEPSGDLHAAALIKALSATDPDALTVFLGGDLMAAAAGREPVIHYRHMAYMGFSEVLRHLPDIRRNMSIARRTIATERPDAVILVDYPSFNLRLAAYAHSLGIPVYYYISPKIWAWKTWRVKKIRRYVRAVFCILPFEPRFYERYGVTVDYVGNPSVSEVDSRLRRLAPADDFLRVNNLDDRPVIALVPGSRVGEIRCNLPVMVEAALRFQGYQSVVAGAPGISRDVYSAITKLPVVDGAFDLMANATAALVTSGTATLECALIGTPQVVCYRSNGSSLAYHLMERLLKVRYVSLPNLITDSAIVPEQLLHQCTPDLLADRLAGLLPVTPGCIAPLRDRQLQGYSLMRRILGTTDAATTTARSIVRDLNPDFIPRNDF